MNRKQIKAFVNQQLNTRLNSKKSGVKKITTSNKGKVQGRRSKKTLKNKSKRYVVRSLPHMNEFLIVLRDELPMKLKVESVDENTALASLTFNDSQSSINQVQTLSASTLLASMTNAAIQLSKYTDNYHYFHVNYIELAFDPTFNLSQFNFTDNYVYWRNGPKNLSVITDLTNNRPIIRHKLREKYSVVLTTAHPGQMKLPISSSAGITVVGWTLTSQQLDDAAVGGGNFNFVMPQGAVLYAPVSSVTFTNIIAGTIHVNIGVTLADEK